MNRHNWTAEEDNCLKQIILEQGVEDWSVNAATLRVTCPSAGTKKRSGKQCRERWFNHLDPSVNKSKWTQAEQEKLFEIHKDYGNKWKQISAHMEGRTDNDIKNRFYSTLRRSLRRLNKFIGKKNSTSQLREIKPSVLTVIINFIYDNQDGDSKDTLVQALRELPGLIFKFATFKPVKQNMAYSQDGEMINNIQIIMQLVEQFKKNYIKEKSQSGKIKQEEMESFSQKKEDMEREQEIARREGIERQEGVEREEEMQNQDEPENDSFSPLVKRQEGGQSMDFKKLRQMNFVAKQISPIITIQRRPSINRLPPPTSFKQEQVLELKINNMPLEDENVRICLDEDQQQCNNQMMMIEEPSMSMSMQSGDPLMADLMVVGKQIQPTQFEATDENQDRHIDQVLYQNYDSSQIK